MVYYQLLLSDTQSQQEHEQKPQPPQHSEKAATPISPRPMSPRVKVHCYSDSESSDVAGIQETRTFLVGETTGAV